MALIHRWAAQHYYYLNDRNQASCHQQTVLDLARRLNDDKLVAEALCLGQICHSVAPHLCPETESFPAANLAAYASQYPVILLSWVPLLIKQGRTAEALKRTQQMVDPLPAGLPTHMLTRQIAFLHAFTGYGRDLATVIERYEEMLAKTKGEEDRLFRLLLLGLFAWNQLRLGRHSSAAHLLEQALTLADQTGYTRPILDLPELAPLLAQATHSAAGRLLHQIESEGSQRHIAHLTSQESAVLELLAQDYKYREIADQLVVTMNTVRFHVRNIYAKLGVHRRMEAVERATSAGLLRDPID